MTMATTAAPTSSRGPLAHIVDALRIDNHQLLLETLRSDPRHSPSNNEFPNSGDAAAGDGQMSLPSHTSCRQRLIFGSDNLRRTLLHQVIARNVVDDNTKHGVGGETTKKSNKTNKSQRDEEDELMRELNDELRSANCEIVQCSEVLSPVGDGSVIGAKLLSAGSTNNGGTNPFDNDTNPNNNMDADPNIITTYLLQGGGFDIPSIASAALHRNRLTTLNRYQKSPYGDTDNNNNSGGSSNQQRLFRFVFLPRMTEMERVLLKELGVQDDVIVEEGNIVANHSSSSGGGGAVVNSLESLPIDLIPLDDDVLSLELCGGSAGVDRLGGGGSGNGEGDKSGGSTAAAASLRHSDVEGCEADVVDVVARSLLKLQLLNQGGSGVGGESDVGVIGRVLGLGPLATAVVDRMMHLRLEEERLDAQMEEEQDDDDYDGEEAYDDEVGRGDNEDGTVGVEAGVLSSAGGIEGDKQQPPIQALMVIDRKVDLVTPMLTPLTYEGLIDEVLQIQVGGCISVKKSIVEPDDQNDDPKQRARGEDSNILLPLNDSDPLYTEVRDKHVEVFGSFLQNQAKALKESHSQFTNRETARDLSEIHQFVKQIPVFTRNLRSLKNHIHIAELVKSAAEATSFRQRWQTERSMLESESQYDTLEDLIASGEPPYRWLRLFCLQSLTSNGIKAARYESLRKEVVQTYGFEYLMVLNDLEAAGFLRKRETFFMDSMATSYSTLRKALNLINAEVDPSNPDDPAYVSSGYAPITVRWIQSAMRGFLGLDEALKELPSSGGDVSGNGRRWIDIEQKSPPESLVEALKQDRGPSLGVLAKKYSESTNQADKEHGKKPVLLVYFVGGVTYMEVAALRFLSKRPSFPYTIVCCTTEIVNGETLLRSLSC